MARMKTAMMESLSFRVYMAIHEYYCQAVQAGRETRCNVYLDEDSGRITTTMVVDLEPGKRPGAMVLKDVSATDYIDDDPSTYTPEEFATACMVAHGEIEALKRGPGRPEIGVRVEVRLPEDLLAAVDARAEDDGVSRAEMVRVLLGEALSIRRRTIYCAMCAEAHVVPESEIGPSEADPVEWSEKAVDDYLRTIGHGCYEEA